MQKPPETFTKEALKDWLLLDPARQFNYGDIYNCMFAAFLKEKLGYKSVTCGNSYFRDKTHKLDESDLISFPEWAQELDCKIAALMFDFKASEVLDFL